MTTATYPLTFPPDAGINGQWLSTNASNAVYWALGNMGNVVQTVFTQSSAFASGSTLLPYDNTIPQNTEGNQYMTLAITPAATTNLLFIKVMTSFGIGAGTSTQMAIALFQDSTANALTASVITQNSGNLNLFWVMAAGTTSSTTFKVRAGRSAAVTLDFNGRSGGGLYNGTMASTIMIKELQV